MANSPPSIKDNPFKRLDALRNKVSGVKAPAPAAAAPPVPARRTGAAAAPVVDVLRGLARGRVRGHWPPRPGTGGGGAEHGGHAVHGRLNI